MGKYTEQANSYAGSVSNLNSELSSIVSKLGRVGDILEVYADSSKDMLSYNVITSNEEIKTEITSIVSETSSYVGALKAKAVELDAEEEDGLAQSTPTSQTGFSKNSFENEDPNMPKTEKALGEFNISSQEQANQPQKAVHLNIGEKFKSNNNKVNSNNRFYV